MRKQDTLVVAIASPSDVGEIRDAIPLIFEKWNAISPKVRIEPRRWEIHTTPAAGGRPQDWINRDVVDKADILVAVFWTKLGSGDQSRSGTIAEIEYFMQKNNPARVMVYFCKKPVAVEPHMIDELKELYKFKDDIRESVLYSEFSTLAEFESNIIRHLTIKVEEIVKGQHPVRLTGRDVRLRPAERELEDLAGKVRADWEQLANSEQRYQIAAAELLLGAAKKIEAFIANTRAGRELKPGDRVRLRETIDAMRDLADEAHAKTHLGPNVAKFWATGERVVQSLLQDTEGAVT